MPAFSSNPFLETLGQHLFGTDGPETRGDRVYFRIVELFILGYAAWFCWDWGLYIQ